MGLFQSGFLTDSFRSLLSGLGIPGRDKSIGLVPSSCNELTNNQRDLEALYRGNWLAKKIVDIPAFDSTREWRAWNAQPDEIEKLENAERAFGLQRKVLDALIKARLYGGSCIVIGLRNSPFNEELDLDSIKEGDLKFVHVVSKWMMAAGPRVRDITSPWFGEPSYYMRSNIPILAAPGQVEPLEAAKLGFKPGEAIWIHPSRVVRIVGTEYPDLETAMDAWGDSVLQACYEALRDAGLVTQSLASMISDAKVDVLKIPGLTQSLSTEAGTNKLMTYLSNANVAKSTINSLVLDKDIDWERMQTTFEGLPDVLQSYLFQCSGAADIPATRLFGRSPEGMNATGDSDTRNYYDRISSDQKTRLTPLLDRLDEVVIRSTLGKRPPDIYYEWNPLWQASAADEADIFLKKAQAYMIDVNANLIPPEALMTARINQLIEDGVYPGLDAALDEVDDAYADDHMDMLRRVPPAPEDMLKLQIQNKKVSQPDPNAIPASLTNQQSNANAPKVGPGEQNEPDTKTTKTPAAKTKATAKKPATKDSLVRRAVRWRRAKETEIMATYGFDDHNWTGMEDGENPGHAFRGNQYKEGESGPEGGGSSGSGHRSSHSASSSGATSTHPRENNAPIGFVSPSVHNLTFSQAISAVGDARHRALAHASNDIDARLGIRHPSNKPVVGAWSDGAEQALMYKMPGATMDQARVASAMKGYIANQKAVLLFEPHHGGDHFLATFKAKGSLDDIHKRLLDKGLGNHTLEPAKGGGATVHVFGMDQDTLDKVDKVAADEKTTPVITKGNGEFLGTTKEDGTDAEQRADARQQYQKIIDEAAAKDSPELRGRDIRSAWNSVRNRWSQRLRDQIQAIQVMLADLDPWQPQV